MSPFYDPRSTGASISVLDEGVQISSAASSLNFVGAGVTATNVGNAITITIPGGGSATFTSETANESPDGSRTSFTFPHSVGVCILNGVCQFVFPGTSSGLNSVTTNTAVFNVAPSVGDDVKNAYSA